MDEKEMVLNKEMNAALQDILSFQEKNYMIATEKRFLKALYHKK